MKDVHSLLALVDAGDSALAVKTDGRLLQFDGKRGGTSGNWILASGRTFKWFVIYQRKRRREPAKIYRATFVATKQSREKGRHIVTFKAVKLVCETDVSWREFADTWSNPVRCIEKPA